MKILLIANMYPSKAYPHYGVFIRNIADGLITRGVELRLVVMRRHAGRLAKSLAYLVYYARTFFSILVGRQSLVYVHYLSHSALPVVMACLFRRTRVICHAHGGDVVREQNVGSVKFFLKRMLSKMLMRVSERVICPSEYFKQQVLIREYGVESDKVFVSPSGGVSPFFQAAPVERVKRVSGQLRLGYVGRITEDKGVMDLLSAITQLGDNCGRLRLTLVGERADDIKARFDAQLVLLGKQHDVVYMQPVSQSALPALYQSFDVLIFPSRRLSESLGLVGLEAMACGTPVIGADIAGISTYLVDGENGLLFPPGDVSALADAIMRFSDLLVRDGYEMRCSAVDSARPYRMDVVMNKLLVEGLSLT